VDTPQRDDEAADKPRELPSRARDTLADKRVRFGCGGLLGLLIVASVVISSAAIFGDVLGFWSLMAFGALAVGACGVLGVTHGDRFFVGLLKVVKWVSVPWF
jgi:hypothetical protein